MENFFLSDLLSYRVKREEDQKQKQKEITKEIEKKISERYGKNHERGIQEIKGESKTNLVVHCVMLLKGQIS